MKNWIPIFVMIIILLPLTNAVGDGSHGMSASEEQVVVNCLKSIGCCSGHVPISWLGYGGGHKHNFCRSLGFDTYSPNTSECIKNCNNNIETKPLQFLGYKKGHKFNFCRSKGYTNYMPAPNGDKFPWGYCYKNK